MAYIPDATHIDFNLRREGKHLIQGPVPTLTYPFQFTSNFDYYRPNRHDFHRTDEASPYVVLRPELAGALWESLKMKGRYILAAANRWTGDASSPLPATIPIGKLEEIDMVHPPFPPIPQLTYNFMELPETEEVVTQRIENWQENSRQLAVWISQAKLSSLNNPGHTWLWPAPPRPSSSNHSSDSSDEHWIPNSSSLDTVFSEASLPPRHTAHAFHTHVERDIKKRVRELSPTNESRDGDSTNKRQLVFWKPSLAQLLELQQSLIHGEVESENGPRTAENLHPHLSSSTLYANSCADDPRISAPPPSPEPISTNTANHSSPNRNPFNCFAFEVAHTSVGRYRNI